MYCARSFPFSLRPFGNLPSGGGPRPGGPPLPGGRPRPVGPPRLGGPPGVCVSLSMESGRLRVDGPSGSFLLTGSMRSPVVDTLFTRTLVSSWSGEKPFSAWRMNTTRLDPAGRADGRASGCCDAMTQLVMKTTARNEMDNGRLGSMIGGGNASLRGRLAMLYVSKVNKESQRAADDFAAAAEASPAIGRCRLSSAVSLLALRHACITVADACTVVLSGLANTPNALLAHPGKKVRNIDSPAHVGLCPGASARSSRE